MAPERVAFKLKQFDGGGGENTPSGRLTSAIFISREEFGSEGSSPAESPNGQERKRPLQSLAGVIPGPAGDPESRAVPLKKLINSTFAALDSGFRFAAPE